MALKGSTTAEQIKNYLLEKIGNKFGVYGLMANLKAESNFKSNNLQQTSEKKLGLTDESYTASVDNGTYTNFVKDSAGYGLAQWTYWSRKQNLLDYAKKVGKSIGDLEMQLEFMVSELKGYKSVWNALVNAKSIKEASDVVLTQYERPADQSDKVKQRRAAYGLELYEQLETDEMKIRDKVLSVCAEHLGIGEPTGDDKFIDWFNKNVLKTWSFAMNVAWCSIFVTYAGVHGGLTGNDFPLTANCDDGMNWFKNRKQWKDGAAYGGSYIPKKGDVVYYSQTHNQNDSTHVGWCKSCDGTLMVVVEGNYSNMVKERTIYLSDPYILGYGIINYPDENGTPVVGTDNKLAGTGAGTAVALETMWVRTGPGTSYEKIGNVSKGKSVEVLAVSENEWLKIVWDTAKDGYAYVSDTKPYFNITWKDNSYKPKEDSYAVGTVVQFKGTKHYTSANSTNAKTCKSGKAKITQIAKGTKHPYHLIATDGGGGTVYGWVDAEDIAPLAQSGYDVWVGKVTASVLNVRTGAGTKHGKLQAWPQLRNGNLVDVLGEVKADDGSTWYYVNIQGHKGYVHSAYITKA